MTSNGFDLRIHVARSDSPRATVWSIYGYDGAVHSLAAAARSRPKRGGDPLCHQGAASCLKTSRRETASL
jgi:hypothetical protein